MIELPILRDLGVILIVAAGSTLLARRVGVPGVIAYIGAGLLLGPATRLLDPGASLALISKLGIALLLFLVGLELSLDKIRAVGRVAVLAGVSQVAATIALGFALARLLGLDAGPALVMAVAVTFSSTVVVIKLLEQNGALDALHGRIAVGILLVQDVAVVVALTLLAGLEDPSALHLGQVGRGLASASVGMVALLGAAFLATRFVLPALFRWLAGSLEALFVWSLTWCFGFILVAGALGLSVEIGAFVAGVGLAQLPYHAELVRRVHPLVSFFLAVFFVTLGAQMELGSAAAAWPAVVGLSAFVLLIKPAILMALIPRFGYGERTSFLAGLTLGQISEFSFILAAHALAAGIVDAGFVSVVSAIGLVTIAVSTALVQVGDRLYERVRDARLLRPFRAPTVDETPPDVGLSDHVIVVGMNTLGRRLVAAFTDRGERVLAIDSDPAKLAGLPSPTLQGSTDHPDILVQANLPSARLLVSALQIEEANILMAYRAREAGVPSSIHAFDPGLLEELERHGTAHLMVSKYDGLRRMVAALRGLGVID